MFKRRKEATFCILRVCGQFEVGWRNLKVKLLTRIIFRLAANLKMLSRKLYQKGF